MARRRAIEEGEEGEERERRRLEMARPL